MFAHVAADSGADVPGAALTGTHRALALVQDWLRDEDLAGSRLVVVTRGAVAVAEGEAPDLTSAPVWGLLRSAQTEHADRFVLLDLDDDEESVPVLTAACATGEPQLALRWGTAFAPRLAPLPAAAGRPGWAPAERSCSPAAPAASARSPPATWCPSTAYGICCWPAAGAPKRPARPH